MAGDVLLIIDMQNVYTRGAKWECRDTEGAARNILRLVQGGGFDDVLITKFIASDAPQGVWQNYNAVNADINSDEWSNALVPQIEPLAKQFKVYSKSKYSSLEIPEVRDACKKAKRVVLSGVVAECCVLFTAFSLIDEGVYSVYITDAVSGLDKPKEDAAVLTLSGLAPLHLGIMTTDEFLAGK